MKRMVLFLVLVLGVGCAPYAERAVDSSNPEMQVDYMGSFADCAVYRIHVGRPIYAIRCGRDVTTSWTETQQVGKVASTTEHRVETIEGPR